MEDGRSVGGEFSGTSGLKSGCGKGCRLSCLSTGSRRPVSSAGGGPGTEDLGTLKADPRFMASCYINLTHIVLL